MALRVCSHCGEDPVCTRGLCDSCRKHEDIHGYLPPGTVLLARWDRRVKIAEHRRLEDLRATIRSRILSEVA